MMHCAYLHLVLSTRTSSLASLSTMRSALSPLGPRTQRPNPTSSEAISPKDDVIRLFDGKTLGDCYTWLKDTKREDPRKVFSVTDGMMHISGDGLGGLVTNKRYRDYHLVLEYKFGDRTWHDRENSARDSGLLVHSNGNDGGYNGTWMPSIEVQIIEGGVGDFVPVAGAGRRRQAGADYATRATSAAIATTKSIWKADGPRETFSSAAT